MCLVIERNAACAYDIRLKTGSDVRLMLPIIMLFRFSEMVFSVQKTGCFFLAVETPCFQLYYLSLIGTYRSPRCIALYAGRMMRGALMTSSIRWAHQPALLAMANSGVYSSTGMPSIL